MPTKNDTPEKPVSPNPWGSLEKTVENNKINDPDPALRKEEDKDKIFAENIDEVNLEDLKNADETAEGKDDEE